MADKFKPCSVENCKDNAHWTKKGIGGLCRNHWRRLKAHGDPNGGRAQKGATLQFYKDALTYNGRDCLTWPYATQHGYGCMRVNGRTIGVHRMVCEAVHGLAPSPHHEAAHTCGKGSSGCINPNHLRWATPTENQADRIEHGTSNRGERCAASRLTEDDVIEIRRLKGKMTQKEIAEIFGVNYITVGDIHNDRTWAWLQ